MIDCDDRLSFNGRDRPPSCSLDHFTVSYVGLDLGKTFVHTFDLNWHIGYIKYTLYSMYIACIHDTCFTYNIHRIASVIYGKVGLVC